MYRRLKRWVRARESVTWLLVVGFMCSGVLLVGLYTATYRGFASHGCWTVPALGAAFGNNGGLQCRSIPYTVDFPSLLLAFGSFGAVANTIVFEAQLEALAPRLVASGLLRGDSDLARQVHQLTHTRPRRILSVGTFAGVIALGVLFYWYVFNHGRLFEFMSGQTKSGVPPDVLADHWWASWNNHPVGAVLWILVGSGALFAAVRQMALQVCAVRPSLEVLRGLSPDTNHRWAVCKRKYQMAEGQSVKPKAPGIHAKDAMLFASMWRDVIAAIGKDLPQTAPTNYLKDLHYVPSYAGNDHGWRPLVRLSFFYYCGAVIFLMCSVSLAYLLISGDVTSVFDWLFVAFIAVGLWYNVNSFRIFFRSVNDAHASIVHSQLEVASRRQHSLLASGDQSGAGALFNYLVVGDLAHGVGTRFGVWTGSVVWNFIGVALAILGFPIALLPLFG